MRINKIYFLICLSAFCCASVSFADDAQQPVSLQSLENFSTPKNGLDAAKMQAIKENGIRIGIQAGMIYRGKQIKKSLDFRSVSLDKIYEFQPLMDRDGFLPPVIGEVSRKIATEGGAQREEYAGYIYRIIVPAKFVRIVPTWRDYLYTGLSDSRMSVDQLPEAIRPKTDAEKKVWHDAVDEGWVDGVKQSDMIFAENMARLDRDYVGMFRYFYLRGKGMIMSPVLSKTPDGIHVTNDEIAIGTGEKAIEQKSSMQPNVSLWGVAR